MSDVKSFFKRDKFAEYIGLELIDVSIGYAKAKLELKNHHLNGVGTAHGGAIFSLADFAFAAASNSHGTVALGINVSISYLKAVTCGILFAEAKEISRSSKLASYNINITNEKNEIIAVFQGMVYRKKDTLSDIKIEKPV